MTTPLVEQIAVALAAEVNAVTVANGYNQTLTALRPKRIDFLADAPGDLTVLLIQDDPDQVEGETPLNTILWRQPFAFLALVVDSETATASIDTRINQVRGDLEKKLMADPSHGGLAIDTAIRPPVYFGESPQFSGIAVVADVFYRTLFNDPYTQA